jgi:signal transduction histidine kinase
LWQVAVLVAAIAASVAAVWVTLSADFLTYPGWLAVQKADFILGPVLAGLYWYRRRPQSRFGPMLIVFGLLSALYVLQSASNSWLFITQRVEAALAQVQEVAHGLYPPLLIASGLPTALRGLYAHAATPLEIDAVGVGRYEPEIESAMYYCCSEAIQNATKHGGRDVHVSVALAEENGRLTFRVVDDGLGFAVGEVRGLGLQNMADRLGALGGRLTIATAPGRGTTISGHVPLRSAIPEP